MSEDYLGRVIGERFQLVELLGQGGHGTVYRARHQELGRDVVLKLLNSDLTNTEDAERRLLKEVEVARSFVHKYAVQVRECGRDPALACLYFTMDAIEGRTLDRVLEEQGALSPERVRRLGLQILEVLEEAHAAGIVHRDLKPANLLMAVGRDGEEEVRVLDFGIAKAISSATKASIKDSTGITMTGTTVGTLPYMSPEQAQGRALDPRSDIYSLGVVLYQALSGRLPIEPEADADDTRQSLLFRLVTVPPPELREVVPHASAGLRMAIMKSLAKNRADRHPTARAFREALLNTDPSYTRGRGELKRPDLSDVALPAGLPPDESTELEPYQVYQRSQLRGVQPLEPFLEEQSYALVDDEFEPQPLSRRGLFLGVLFGLLVLAGVILGGRQFLVRAAAVPTPTPLPATPTPEPVDERLVLSPRDGFATSAFTVNVTGEFEGGGTSTKAWVAGVACPVDASGFFRLEKVGLVEGPNTIRVEVAPPHGSPIVRELQVTVDRLAPKLELSSPADGDVTSRAWIAVRGRAEDPTLERVVVNGENVRVEGLRFTTRVPLPDLNQPRQLEVQAWDRAGHVTKLQRTVRRVPPRIVLELEQPGDAVNRETVQVSGRIGGEIPPEKVMVRVDGRVAPVRNREFSVQLQRAEGTHRIEVQAEGGGGEPVAVRREFQVDLSPPLLTLDEPQDGASTRGGKLRLRGRVEDASPWVELQVGANRVRVKPGEALDSEVELAPGTTELVVIPVDAAGNTGQAVKRRIAGDTVGPAWYARLDAASKPPLPLPQGVVFGPVAGEYRNTRDDSILVWVPAATFTQGSKDGLAHEKPVRRVTIRRGYFIGKFEVSWRQFRRFCRATRRKLPQNAFPVQDTEPVHDVTWKDAEAYCRWAGLRLPSEAEWELAARGTDGRIYPWGDQDPGATLANVADESTGFDWREVWNDSHAHTAPVGSFPAGASPYGCHNMAGNVFEWVGDWYADAYTAGPLEDPRGPESGTRRVVRGSSWFYDAVNCRAAARSRMDPEMHKEYLGFRVARDGQ